LRIDVGCGRAKDRKMIGIDINDYGQEIIFDIRKGLPFCNESIKEIKIHSVLEHLASGDVIYFMKEAHRTLQPSGTIDIIVPYAGSESSFRDPTHKSFWRENTFAYFTGERPKRYDILPKQKFKILKLENRENEIIHAKLKKN